MENHFAGGKVSERRFIGCQPSATGFTVNVTLPAVGKSNPPDKFERLNFV